MADNKKSGEEVFFSRLTSGQFNLDQINDYLTGEELRELNTSYCLAAPGEWRVREQPIFDTGKSARSKRPIGTRLEMTDSLGMILCQDTMTEQLETTYNFIQLGNEVFPYLSRVLHAHFDNYQYLHADYAIAKNLMDALKGYYKNVPHGMWENHLPLHPKQSSYIYLKTPTGDLICSLYTYQAGRHQHSLYRADFIRHFYCLFPKLDFTLEEYAHKFGQLPA